MLRTLLNGEFVLSPTVPMAWIFLLAFVLAEISNWQTSGEIARLCGMLGPADAAIAARDPAKKEIDAICRDRSPRTFYWSDVRQR